MAGEKSSFLYMKLYLQLRDMILGGEIPLGEKLPTEQELQATYKVSRDTLRKSMALLEKDGLIERKASRGTFVVRARIDYPLSKLEGFSEQMRRRGRVPSSEIISIELSSDIEEHILEKLKLQPDEKVYSITRIRKADNEPMAYEIAYISHKMCPDLQIHLSTNASLLDIYTKEYGLKLYSGNVIINAVLPTPKMQKYLMVEKNTPLLKLAAIYYLEDGTPVDCGYSYHISEKYEFSTVLYR